MNRNSRLLQLVVAGVLLSQGGTTAATTYDDDTVTVPGSYWGGTSTTFDYYPEPPDEVYDYDVYDFSGDGYDSGGGDSEEPTQENTEYCEAIEGLVPPGCDLRNPPVLTVNGCGGGMFTYAVPDYLVVNGVPVFRLGAIFRDACNAHDTCYGTYLADKATCDAQLEQDMIGFARSELPSFQWYAYGAFIRMQAAAYSNALQTQPILSIANGLYGEAQLQGSCRAYAVRAAENGCLE